MAKCRVVTALALVLLAPATAVTGTDVDLKVRHAPAGAVVRFEQRRDGEWRRVGRDRAGRTGRADISFKLRRRGPHRVRAVARGRTSRPVRIRSRYLTLAAVGDINLGNGPGAYMRRYGYRYPWRRVAPTLRAADIAFGNLECAVSRRGSPVPKQFNFRGSPAALRRVASFAGFDALNVANNHSGDYGRRAFLDTLRFTRTFAMTPVGGGVNRARALRARVLTRHGLRVAFVGFSDRLPLSFYATSSRPGIAFASLPAIRRAVRRARRRADVVVATFHWGDELSHTPNARQRLFARTALHAGAHAVIGAHPHVLQPRRRLGSRIVASSLGHFVFSTGGGATSETGILRLRLSGRGVEHMRLLRGRIVAAQPRLGR
jgi:poly-gamma-glutamate capsule biosynthesis protein CapA/YwtB (metallophosphatase superfamily)